MRLTWLLNFRHSSIAQLSKMKSYVIWFSNEHTDFRMPELEALFRLFEVSSDVLQCQRSIGPFVILDFPNEDVPQKIMSRSVLAHSCFELWSEGDSLGEVHRKLETNLQLFEPVKQESFRFRVDTFGKVISQNEKLAIIETFRYVPLDGKVDLINPDLKLHLLQYYGLDPNHAPEKPYHLFFRRWIADGQRGLASKLSLKTRKFIANTSMDPFLSLLMANLAVVDKNDVVCDPFVGTGSLLIAAAQMGAHVCGGDIDYLLMHGRTRPSRAKQKNRDKDESVLANFQQYGLENKYLDVIINDASKPIWRTDFKLDAIITDPPYGIREATEKIGCEKRDFKIKSEHLPLHIPSKLDYTLPEIYKDLINFSAKHLNITDYEADKLPQNPCFKLAANCEQPLTGWAARRLLVFEKIAEPTEYCETIMDSTALMYRVKFFESGGIRCRKERKSAYDSQFGEGSKCGHLHFSSNSKA